MDTNRLFELIRERCDPEEIVDLCDIGVGELVLRLRGPIMEHRDRFEAYLELYDEKLKELYDEDANEL